VLRGGPDRSETGSPRAAAGQDSPIFVVDEFRRPYSVIGKNHGSVVGATALLRVCDPAVTQHGEILGPGGDFVGAFLLLSRECCPRSS
jgi:hypothetical protein